MRGGEEWRPETYLLYVEDLNDESIQRFALGRSKSGKKFKIIATLVFSFHEADEALEGVRFANWAISCIVLPLIIFIWVNEHISHPSKSERPLTVSSSVWQQQLVQRLSWQDDVRDEPNLPLNHLKHDSPNLKNCLKRRFFIHFIILTVTVYSIYYV